MGAGDGMPSYLRAAMKDGINQREEVGARTEPQRYCAVLYCTVLCTVE